MREGIEYKEVVNLSRDLKNPDQLPCSLGVEFLQTVDEPANPQANPNPANYKLNTNCKQ